MSVTVHMIAENHELQIDENGILHNYESHRDLDTNQILDRIDILPQQRKELAARGIGDFQFADYMDRGIRYEDCTDPIALQCELEFGRYRTAEAKALLEKLLIEKFGYKWLDAYFNGKKQLVEGSKYEKEMKAEASVQKIIKRANSGEEMLIRINDEIVNFDKHGYHVCWCTCKGARGASADLVFSPNINFKHYKNRSDYFHVLDENGNVMKTRNHYCMIKGHVDVDENGDRTNQIDKRIGRVTVVVNSIRLAEESEK